MIKHNQLYLSFCNLVIKFENNFKFRLIKSKTTEKFYENNK